MDKLYNWRARRAGGRITITHSTGKVVNIDSIFPRRGKIIAAPGKDRVSNAPPGVEYELIMGN